MAIGINTGDDRDDSFSYSSPEVVQEWRKDWTEEQLAEAKRKFEEAYPDNPCTCERCPAMRKCALAWDLYNTAGDCLYSK